jgi:hypothetical protein
VGWVIWYVCDAISRYLGEWKLERRTWFSMGRDYREGRLLPPRFGCLECFGGWGMFRVWVRYRTRAGEDVWMG